jgi:hypothetical protein
MGSASIRAPSSAAIGGSAKYWEWVKGNGAMAYSLLLSPRAACEKHWDSYKDDCSGFARAVAMELCVLLPTVNLFTTDNRQNADIITMWIKNWLPLSESPFLVIPSGESAAITAMNYADKGDFVIVGATSDEINQYRAPDKQTTHGHLAVVTPGAGKNGFPRGYWGSYGSTGKKDESLSVTFSHSLKNDLHYFAVMRGIIDNELKLRYL